VLAEFLQHLKDCCQFLFREHADLKIQMRATLGLAGHSTLADEHENCQKYAFGGDDEGQDAERKWIKCFDSWDHVEIYQAPTEDEKQLSQQESCIADKLCNRVASSLRGSTAIKGLMLQLGDGIDVELRRIRSNSAWYRIFPGLFRRKHRSVC